MLTFSLLSVTQGFERKSLSVGLGYYSENFLFKTADSDTGTTGLLGEASYPLVLKYDMVLKGNWFIAPQLSYTLLPRKTNGSTADVTNAHLIFQFGKNFSMNRNNVWDWSFGPGYLYQSIKGKGGTMVLNNGTGTSTFAVPGNTSTIQKVTINGGVSYSFLNYRVGFDLFFLNFFSNTKRSQNFMINFTYQFKGMF